MDTFDEIINNLRADFDLLKAIGDFSTFKSTISRYRSDNSIVDPNTDKLIADLDTLFASYINFIRGENNRENAVVFMRELLAFRGYYDTQKDNCRNAMKMFNSVVLEDTMQPNCSIMEIQLLKVKLTFEEFTLYLGSIQKIYSELSHIRRGGRFSCVVAGTGGRQ